MKDLVECEATRISDLESIEKLETQCSELRSQRSQAKEQLCEMKTRLSEAEQKNRQLAEQKNDALTVRVNRCLQGFVLCETQIEHMVPKKSEKVRKMVPLKVPYEKLRPFRHELSELRLEFLLWNWNCVSASIWKEVMDKSATKGEELRGNPMLWTIEHWTKVMGPCAGSDGDLLFDKNSVGLTCVEEFSYGPLFETGRQGTNGWKTVEYKDLKRRVIALGIMHILRPARTTYETAWQVGFFERILKE
ncbi:hypothetical protein AXG93_4553s1000 [Marchantia polymorpha subsp. ruderalis]|uniref:Uncharacterized protein n=1 Tax=Marchantia polymorpha subsp. ruderalis TaxID=1480154 RepID=A0A176WLS0_MARPO|nr:hypothetical protein AXG93_4553s1000 [Marchantia polymorpha subsp. ruderalis]